MIDGLAQHSIYLINLSIDRYARIDLSDERVENIRRVGEVDIAAEQILEELRARKII